MEMPIKKEDIIKASINIFVREGFDRPSMDSIAKEANVSKRTLYKYFSNKRVLLDDIVIYLISIKHNEVSCTYRPQRNINTQLQELIMQKVSHMLEPDQLKLMKIIFSEFLKDQGFLKEQIQEVIKTDKARLKWIEDAQKDHKIRGDQTSTELLELLGDMIMGIIVFPILFNRKKSINNADIILVSDLFLYHTRKAEK